MSGYIGVIIQMLEKLIKSNFSIKAGRKKHSKLAPINITVIWPKYCRRKTNQSINIM